MPAVMKTVIFITGLDKYPDRMKQAGIADYARRQGWNLQTVEPIRSRTALKALTDLWSPSGFIISCAAGLNTLPPSAYGKTPTVFFTFPEKKNARPICRVYNDARSTAMLAAQTLLKLNLASYGYVNWFKPMSWNESRRQSFADIMALHGKPFKSFSMPSAGPTQFTKALVPWLCALPKPCGLFAANDAIARLVKNACKLARLSIPEDVALVGVDNDVDFCEESSPTISSIRLDHLESGRLAAQLLDRMMSGRIRKPADVTYPCAEVVNRESTRRFANSDKAISEIVERIRKEACSGLSAASVVRGCPYSRRMAEIRFRKMTGKSILEEIRNVRLQKAVELLKSGNHDLTFIAHQTGYATLPAFSAFFKAETGVSPRAWRRRVTSGGLTTGAQRMRTK